MYNIMQKVPDGKSMEKKRKKQSEKSYPCALTISGSDSAGTSGIQADLRTFNAFGVFGCSAVTAVISQNPTSVKRNDPVAAGTVASQIEAVLEAVEVDYVKTGITGSAASVEVIARAVEKYKLPLVCDPAMISDNGERLLADDAVTALSERLMPLARWITPNIPEAELLLGYSIGSMDDQLRAARELNLRFGAAVWLKGGHLTDAVGKGKLPRVTDVICREGRLWKLSSFKVDVPDSTAHGIGCTLSAAFTAANSLEMHWKEAICESRAFVMGSLIENIRVGRNLNAMYPPGNDYMTSVQLEETEVK